MPRPAHHQRFNATAAPLTTQNKSLGVHGKGGARKRLTSPSAGYPWWERRRPHGAGRDSQQAGGRLATHMIRMPARRRRAGKAKQSKARTNTWRDGHLRHLRVALRKRQSSMTAVSSLRRHSPAPWARRAQAWQSTRGGQQQYLARGWVAALSGRPRVAWRKGPHHGLNLVGLLASLSARRPWSVKFAFGSAYCALLYCLAVLPRSRYL